MCVCVCACVCVCVEAKKSREREGAKEKEERNREERRDSLSLSGWVGMVLHYCHGESFRAWRKGRVVARCYPNKTTAYLYVRFRHVMSCDAM